MAQIAFREARVGAFSFQWACGCPCARAEASRKAGRDVGRRGLRTGASSNPRLDNEPLHLHESISTLAWALALLYIQKGREKRNEFIFEYVFLLFCLSISAFLSWWIGSGCSPNYQKERKKCVTLQFGVFFFNFFVQNFLFYNLIRWDREHFVDGIMTKVHAYCSSGSNDSVCCCNMIMVIYCVLWLYPYLTKSKFIFTAAAQGVWCGRGKEKGLQTLKWMVNALAQRHFKQVAQVFFTPLSPYSSVFKPVTFWTQAAVSNLQVVRFWNTPVYTRNIIKSDS